MDHTEWNRLQSLRRLNKTLVGLWTARHNGIAIRRKIKNSIREYRKHNAKQV